MRAQLEARTKWLRSPEAILRALGVPLETMPGSFRPDIARTVRRARLTYHPDRHQVRAGSKRCADTLHCLIACFLPACLRILENLCQRSCARLNS